MTATTRRSISNDEAADAFVTVSRALVGIAIRSINAAPVAITLPQHRLMVVLGTEGPQKVGRLADHLGSDQSNVSRQCDRLQRIGVITRQRSHDDRRTVTVLLTPAGRKLLNTVNAHRRLEIRRVLATMSRRQVQDGVRALRAFSDAAHEPAEWQWSADRL